MQVRRRELRFACLAAASSILLSGCAWKAWIPGERSWNPEVVVDPSKLATQLALDTAFVDEISCYDNVCDRRFRLVVEHPGTLTVRAIFDLISQDQQARLVVEAPRGVLGQASTGRGPRTDVTPLVVRRQVNAGVYFVLLQSIGGGPAPFELTAALSRGVAPDPDTNEPTEIETDPLLDLRKIDMGANAGAAYDPVVDFGALRTYAFPALPGPDTPIPAGTSLMKPEDRKIRRLLAEALELKGLRQASGLEAADLTVDFDTSEVARDYHALPLQPAYQPDARGKLSVGMVETRTDRVAWHSWSTYGVGPGAIHSDEIEPILRKAVADALAKFPPN